MFSVAILSPPTKHRRNHNPHDPHNPWRKDTMKSYQILPVAVILGMLALGCSLPVTQPPAGEAPASPSPDAGLPEAPQFAVIDLAGPGVGTTMTGADESLFVFVLGGPFTMGSSDPATPSHVVDVSDFWIQRSKVTNAQYAFCVAAGICSPPQDSVALAQMQRPELRDRPVTAVSWEQAHAYCEWIGGNLPTEAQWEKTARGPESNLYPWGSAEPACDLLNAADCLGDTSPVTSYPAGRSYYGALDMAGNAHEWAQDWYDADYYAASPSVDPPGPAAAQPGTGRVVRGSSFTTSFDSVAAAARDYADPADYKTDLGFRCVMDAPVLPVPFCQATAFKSTAVSAAGAQQCLPPVVELGGTYCSQKVPFANFSSASPIVSATSLSLKCKDQTGGTWACTGPPQATGEVTACSCKTQPQVSEVAALTCPVTHELSSENLCVAKSDGDGDQTCPAGFSARSSEGVAVCIADSQASFRDAPATCPAGSYFDTAAETCVGYGPASRSCLPGFNLDSANHCCASPVTPGELVLNAYPGCWPFESYDPLTHDCVGSTLSDAAAGSCVTFKIYIGSCGEIKCAGKNYQVCKKTVGCVWEENACKNVK